MSRKLTFVLLPVGDLLFLAAYVFEFQFFDSNPPRAAFDLAISFLPLITAWFLAGAVLRVFEPALSWKTFLKRSVLCWLAANTASYAVRAAILWFGFRFMHLPLPAVVDALIGLLPLALWRGAYKLFYDLVTIPRFTRLKSYVWGGLAVLAVFAVVFPLPWLINLVKYSPTIFGSRDAPQKPAALVLGAGVWSTGAPSSVLKERVSVAADLYHLGKVEKLLLSGDNRPAAHQETEAMRQLALQMGVPEQDLILDPAGERTYASCERARSVYQLTSVLIVSQSFQLPRALYLCDSLGLEGLGVSSDRANEHIKSLIYWHLREIPAAFAAWWEILF